MEKLKTQTIPILSQRLAFPCPFLWIILPLKMSITENGLIAEKGVKIKVLPMELGHH